MGVFSVIKYCIKRTRGWKKEVFSKSHNTLMREYNIKHHVIQSSLFLEENKLSDCYSNIVSV